MPAAASLEIRLCSPEDLGANIPARGFELFPRITTVRGAVARVTNDTLVLAHPRLTQTDSGGLKPRMVNLGRDAEVALALADQCGVQREQVHAAETAGRTVAGLYLAAVTLAVLGIAVIFLMMKAQGTNIGP